MSNMPRGFLPRSKSERLVAGLRDSNYEKPTYCKVFRAQPDGTKGQLLRIIKPTN